MKQKMTVREYTEAHIRKYGSDGPVTAGELLDLLNKIESLQPVDEPDHGDIYGAQVLGGEPGKLKAGAL